MDNEVREKLCKSFKINTENCDEIESLFYDKLMPHLKTKYLSHLVSTIEDIVNKEIKQNNKNMKRSEGTETVENALQSNRPFSLLLIPMKISVKAKTFDFNSGSIIAYNP